VFAMGVVEVAILLVVVPAVGLLAAYGVVRLGVAHGMADAQRRLESERVRADLRLGAERSPNSRG
jgi:hypothetical protein